MTRAEPYFVKKGYSFVAYANRDSVPFREFYKIPEAETVVRGSLRYDGNPAFIHVLATLGWLDTKEYDWLKAGLTWAEIQKRLTGADDTNERYKFYSRLLHFAKHPMLPAPSSPVSRRSASFPMSLRANESSRA